MRLCFHETGKPCDVLRLEPSEARAPRGHEVLVRMLYAPINPADLNLIEGTYGKQPQFPAVPGNEGAGRVEDVGDAVESLTEGDLVIPLHPVGTWQRHFTIAENQLARLPEGFDPIQASMLRVNPTTAWQLLHQFRDLEPGDFVAQNAANSGVGRAVIQIARHLGLRTLNFVRRKELIPELTALGGDVVMLDNHVEDLPSLRRLLDGKPLRLALNAVGGESALHLMELLSPGGVLVTYGAMSRRSLKVPNKLLIFKDLELRGYWLSRWMEKASHQEIHDTLVPLVDLMKRGALTLPVERVFPIAEFQTALAVAAQDGRGGKVILAL
ncbi:MAG: MDR family NADPH-dependent oxidoreductase [Roseimicrobium sp.]